MSSPNKVQIFLSCPSHRDPANCDFIPEIAAKGVFNFQYCSQKTATISSIEYFTNKPKTPQPAPHHLSPCIHSASERSAHSHTHLLSCDFHSSTSSHLPLHIYLPHLHCINSLISRALEFRPNHHPSSPSPAREPRRLARASHARSLPVSSITSPRKPIQFFYHFI